MANNRELSQFGNFISVNDTSENIGISTDVIISGVLTATRYYGDGSQLTGIATVGGGTTLGITTITDLTVTGVTSLTSLVVSGVSTFGNIVLDPVGIITAASGIVTYYGDGTYLSGVTSGIGINTEGGSVGTGITILDFRGTAISNIEVDLGIGTIFAQSGENYWESTAVGINTLSNVGIGTTNPTSILTVNGDINVTGVITSTSFIITGGTSSQFLKADGSVDSNDYLTTTGSGINLTGVVTSITAGSGISIDQATGNVTITASGGAAGGSQWVSTDVGIHTLSNVGIGTTNPTSALTVTGDVIVTGIVTAADFNSTSDIKLKENIQTVSNALQITDQLRGVRFDWKENHKPSYGVIAQELERILPELVSDTDPKTVNYNGLIGVLIEAVKELSEEVKNLRNK